MPHKKCYIANIHLPRYIPCYLRIYKHMQEKMQLTIIILYNINLQVQWAEKYSVYSRIELIRNYNSKYDLYLHAAEYSMQYAFNSFILPTRSFILKFLLITLNVDNASM